MILIFPDLEQECLLTLREVASIAFFVVIPFGRLIPGAIVEG